jgi:hypothetical protein
MNRILLLTCVFLLLTQSAVFSQALENRHDPKVDINLSPTFNSTLNPEKNSNINPKYNWNINPVHNNDVNPEFNSTINPLNHFELNPDVNKTLNPMYHNEYHPKNPSWKGLYIFNNTDDLIGYVSVATQQLMLSFDAQGEWTGFFVKAAPGIYNHFDVKAVWDGKYLCFDSVIGYNLFNKDGTWTGQHIK